MSKNSALDAVHLRITIAMRDRLRDGFWSPGQVLPGRRELAREFGVSPATLERAILPLLNEGILRADGRRGTYVDDGAASGTAEPVRPGSPPTVSRIAERRLNLGIVASMPHRSSERIGQDAYVMRVMTDVMERAFAAGEHSAVCVNRRPMDDIHPVPLEESIRAGFEMGLDGLVVLCLDLDPKRAGDALAATEDNSGPVVCVTAGELDRPFPHVMHDDYSAGYQAAQHLLRQGHESIYVVAPFRAGWAERRIDGVRAALLHRGLPESNLCLLRGNDEPWDYFRDQLPPIQQAISQAFDEGWQMEGAVVAVHDIVAFGVVLEGLSADRLPGRDYALIGFDDHPTARLLGISTMRQPMEAMAQEAAQMLVQAVHGNRTGLGIRLQSELVARRSTAQASLGTGGFSGAYSREMDVDALRSLLAEEFQLAVAAG